MAIHVLVHLQNEDPFQADMDDMPAPTSSYFYLKNIRTREGKPVNWSGKGTVGIMYPWSRVMYIEVVVQGREDIEKHYQQK